MNTGDDVQLALQTLWGVGLSPEHYPSLQEAALGAAEIVRSLRDQLADPPPDVQELVIEKLRLVSHDALLQSQMQFQAMFPLLTRLASRAIEKVPELKDEFIARIEAMEKAVERVPKRFEEAERLRTAAHHLINLLRQADPTCTDGRHPEWPLQILAADDMAPKLCGALMELQKESGWQPPAEGPPE